MNETDELVELVELVGSHCSKLFWCYLLQGKVPCPHPSSTGKTVPIDFFDLGTKREKEINRNNYIIRLWDYMACLGDTQILKLLKGKIRYLTLQNIPYHLVPD